MIIRVEDEKRANYCDLLLTKLILDERKYDKSIDKDYTVNNYFKNVIKDKNNILLCYEEDNIIKGYIYLKKIENGYLIDGLYVLEEYRNNGIAHALIDKALMIIKEKNGVFVDINVMSNNIEAIKIYKSYGFNEIRVGLRKNI